MDPEEIHILLAEDNSTDTELIAEAFRECALPYRLEVATDGEEALRILHLGDVNPNLLLLDLNLPKKDGFEVLQAVRENPLLKTMPVIVLTNSQSEDDILRAYSQGCNAYVRKPLGFEELTQTISAIEAFWFRTATLPNNIPKPVPTSKTAKTPRN